MTVLPPLELRAHLQESRLNRPASFLPGNLVPAGPVSRRSFLQAAAAGVALFGAQHAIAAPLEFSPLDEEDSGATPPAQALQRGQIPQDFWSRPRELWLRRQGYRDEVRAVYWRDGQLIPEGYWQVCSLLRDVHANLMTTMDPAVLDILRGITGYYEAWNYRQPIILTSGYRTTKTNQKLAGEGAAHNSMHLYGKAVDLYVPGVPSRDIGILAMHLRQGGVGFYPKKGFTHIDTGRLRVWGG